MGVCELGCLLFVSVCGSIGMYTSVFECVSVCLCLCVSVCLCTYLYLLVHLGDYIPVSSCLYVCLCTCDLCVCTRGLRMPPVGGIWLLDMFGLALPVFSTS